MAICLALGAGLGPVAASAAPPVPQFGLAASAGTCVSLPGQMTLSFSSALGPGNLSPDVGIHGSATCAGLPLLQSLNVDLTGNTLAFTCAGGAGIIGGAVGGSTGLPPSTAVTATIVDEGPSLHLTLVSTTLVGVGDLAWSTPAAIAGCPLGTTTSTQVVGSFTFAFLG